MAVVGGVVILVGLTYLVLWLKPGENPNDVSPVVKNETSTVAVDISEWKTYRNTEYGFEVKHPESWNLEVFNSEEIRLSYGFLALFIDPLGKYSCCDEKYLAEEEELILGGIKALKREFKDDEDVFQVGIYVLSNNKYPAFHMYMTGLNAKNFITPEEINLVESIFSTFKFIEP